MPSIRQLFLSHVAKTNEMPLMLEVDHAKGIFIYDTTGKKYYDMNSGISVSSLGHCHPAVVDAVTEQVQKHMHTMVYGEHIHSPQAKYAGLLTAQLADGLDWVYFVMTGTETVEVAMKMVRKYTGRTEIFSCAGAYHGSTYGAEALRSDIEFTMNFAPGVPGVRHIGFNNEADLEKITTKTAAVIVEPVQAESGVIPPVDDYLIKLKTRCEEVGALLVLDEIQTGFGRTGHLFAHQKYNVTPDILLVAKSMGGGMPIGALVSSEEIFSSMIKKPALGHITTFGGHPVSCAAAYATLSTILDEDLPSKVLGKEKLILEQLKHPIIREVRSSGMMMAVELTKRKYLKHVVAKCMELGLIVDWFLFNDRSFRVAPPLIITDEQIVEACSILRKAMDYAEEKYN
ncbi:aspartate aminotransferase family protein [Portibacter lacus]|uniref:Aspartate aminotransferase family protein n=1 Tax=Portibacter lacus TaxID=1099794 RepID=A0AA37WF39_9BACT|nr:aspartate aminotransferase family protein [Portibacter lacus]GLR16575.1 aspartate aminotransferase family protein [Portibacter lacus]